MFTPQIVRHAATPSRTRLNTPQPQPQFKSSSIQPHPSPSGPPSFIPTQVNDTSHHYLLQGESLAVKYLAQIPQSYSNLSSNVISATVDSKTGYMAIALGDRCTVFSLPKVSNTSYTLPLPPQSGIRFLAIIPQETQIGLLAASANGVLRYWNSVAFPGEFVNGEVSMSNGEYGTYLLQCDPIGFLYGTTKGSLSKIQLVKSVTSLISIVARPIIRPLGFMTQMLKFTGIGSNLPVFTGIGTAGSQASAMAEPGNKNVISIASVVRTDARPTREVFVLTKSTLQKWLISRGTDDKLVLEQEFLSLLTTSLARDISDADRVDLAVELLDIGCLKTEELVVLATCQVKGSPLVVLLVLVSITSEGSIIIHDKRPLKDVPDGALRTRPRLAVSNGGPGVFVVFHNALITTVVHENIAFQETVKLRNSDSDRILAVESDAPTLSTSQRDVDGISHLICMCAESAILSIEMYTNKIIARDTGMCPGGIFEANQGQLTERLRISLEQALLFGGENEANNPISYVELNETQPGCLEQAAVELSNSILDGTSKYMPNVLTDLRSELGARLSRLEKLMDLIVSKGALEQISEKGRFQLSFNAEKIAASIHLYNFQNTLADTPGHQPQLLMQAMELMVKQHHRREEIDYRRAFYRYDLNYLTGFLTQIHNAIMSEFSTGFDPQLIVSILDANSVFHVILSNALAYRQAHLQTYGLDLQHPPIESWTATNDVQIVLQGQFDATKSLVLHLERSAISLGYLPLINTTSPEASPLSKLKRQLCRLADLIYSAVNSHELYIKTNPASSLDATSRIGALPQAQKNNIYSLLDLGCGDDAYRLSEKYEDVETLADVCIRRPDAQSRIPLYIDTFGQRFTQVLYRIYLSEGLWKQLLSQDPCYDEFVSNFLNQQNVPWLSWIQDVKTQKYADAGEKLQSVAMAETSSSKQSLALSLSFLSLVSNTPTSEAEALAVIARISEVDVLLRLNAVSSSLADAFSNGIPPESRAYLDQVEVQRPAMVKLYQGIVEHIVHDGPMTFDDLVDILTLTPDGDFVSAMETALEMYAVPSLRSMSLIKTIWRRAWITDRWAQFVQALPRTKESEMRRQLRQSHAYALFQCIRERGNEFSGSIKAPSEVFYEEGEGNIRTRSIRLSTEEQDALVADYKNENTVLYDLVSNHNLDQIYEEMRGMQL